MKTLVLALITLFFSTQSQAAPVGFGLSQLDVSKDYNPSNSLLVLTGNQPLQFNVQNQNNNLIELDLERSMLFANLATDVIAGINVAKMDPSQDKERHFLVGHVIGNVTNGAMQILLPKTMENRKVLSTLAGFASSMLIGLAKEYRDSKGLGHADASDAIATAVGGICGSITMSI